MYLKRLESIGFKSFAERITVNFVQGVTAVVGPNGSGKSNITDAIRWVLGEQSIKSLRGSKMEDIIFQGSDTRKPLNVAEVTLVLDNSDQMLPINYDEVSVTRRVYRSGESEFYLNKQACRLKDIIDLFLDSGLGRDAFSTISQGKVEEIISSKPEERRSIFEEAAGVLKYKQRKRKAELKLAETESNLSRVQDILFEIDSQIEPLEIQAQTAKQYIARKAELKNEEISLLITEIETLNKDWQRLLQIIENDQIASIDMQKEINEQESFVQQVKQTENRLAEDMEQEQNNLLQATKRLEQLMGEKELLQERMKHLVKNKDNLLDEMKRLTEQLNKLTVKLAEEKTVFQSIKTERKNTQESIAKLKKFVFTDRNEITLQIEKLKADYIEVLSEQAAQKNENQSLATQLEQLALKSSTLKSKKQDLATKLADTSEKFTMKENEISEDKVKRDNFISKLATLKAQFEEQEKQDELNREKLSSGQQIIAKLKSRKDLLEEMKDEYQGFFHGVKSILKARENQVLKGIHGAVIELINIPKQYLVAVETILGGQAQHIVTDDEKAARKAIQWLKQTNNGRATFLPLNIIEPRNISSQLLSQIKTHPGFVNIAASIIKVDKQYEKIVGHLMGNTVVVKTLKDANEIAEILLRRYRLVTLDGDIVNPGGAMSGGAVKKANQALFSRENDIVETTEKLREFEQREHVFKEKITSNRVVMDKIVTQIKQMEAEITSHNQSIQQSESSLHELRLNKQSQQEQLDFYLIDQKQFTEDQSDLKQRKLALEQALAKSSEQIIQLKNEVDLLTKQELDMKENHEKLKADYHRHEVIFAEQDERYRSKQNTVQQLVEQLDRLKEEEQELAEQIALTETVESAEDQKKLLNEKIIKQQADNNRLQTDLAKMRNDRTAQLQKIADAEQEIKAKSRVLQQFKTELQEKEVKANRLDVELETRLTHLQTEYTTTYEKAVTEYDYVENIPESKEKVKQIKQSIRQLGTVNLGAIEEYDRLHERYEFLSTQQTDLTEAKDTLYTIIKEMDAEMIKAFKTTFEQIKENFTLVFKELFGGGFADLKLTEPKDLLQTGVEIIARPPGKKLRHIGLLSGGEKALTAIALLFSILQVRPVPFCILDEAESALDEANVIRFARYIKKHRGDTQFIVITHRKGTMEEADVLYGVTMQESGVSKLVSVKLEETLEYNHS